MTLEGAINLKESDDYIIYTMNSVTTGQYGVVVSKNINGTLNMLVDLHMKNSFDGVNSGAKTKEQLVSEISEEYQKLKVKYIDGMLVMPMIDDALFQNTVATGDKQKMFDEVKQIGAITSELYKKLTDSGIDKQKINQKIIIIEKMQEDEKFVAWLKEQMPNFVDGVLYSEFNNTQDTVSPLVNNNIFGPAQEPDSKVEETVVNSVPVTGGIFDNVAPVDSVVSVAPVQSDVTSAGEVAANAIPVANVDIFGIPNDVQGIQQSQPVSNPVQNPVVQNNVVPEASVVSNPAPIVEGPKPVESAALEGTMAFDPILNPGVTNVNNDVTSNNNEEKSKAEGIGSKGFVNLAILAVVLIVVTVISIELGKFLYSVYGA